MSDGVFITFSAWYSSAALRSGKSGKWDLMRGSSHSAKGWLRPTCGQQQQAPQHPSAGQDTASVTQHLPGRQWGYTQHSSLMAACVQAGWPLCLPPVCAGRADAALAGAPAAVLTMRSQNRDWLSWMPILRALLTGSPSHSGPRLRPCSYSACPAQPQHSATQPAPSTHTTVFTRHHAARSPQLVTSWQCVGDSAPDGDCLQCKAALAVC